MKKIHIVPHTHWDREWYFTLQDTFVLSDFVFSEVIEELKKDQAATFCLDGQASVIKDYLKLYPEKRDEISRLITNGQLHIGPWYTQTDCLYVNGESIIRNLYYGQYLANNYGGSMNVAYLPDTFGFNAQMPTIVKNCGIDNLIFRRGGDYQKNLPDTLFNWRGLGTKSVKTVHLLEGYGIGHRLEASDKYVFERLEPYINKVSKHTNSDNLLICAGGDQTAINHELNKKLNEINEMTNNEYVQSTYPNFFEATKEYFNAEYQGDFREANYDRVHRTIGGIHYDIKKGNFDIEQKLLKRLEPLVAIGRQFDIKFSSKLLYEAWELIMEGHAHDAMGGCVTDNVAKQIIDRFEKADEIVDGLENYIKFRIAEILDLQDNQIIVFNTDIVPFEGLKKISFMSKSAQAGIKNHQFSIIHTKHFAGKDNLLIEAVEGDIYINEDPYYQITGMLECSLPAMGYKVFSIDDNLEITEIVDDNLVFENSHYKLEFDNGIRYHSKVDGVIIDNLISFEDCGNDGDTYDFSPLHNDSPIIFNPQFKSIKRTKLATYVTLQATTSLPTDLENRLTKQSCTNYTVELQLELTADKGIGVQIDIDNNILSHRLRAVIATDIIATHSTASVPFGFINYEILNGQYPNWDGASECPVDIYPTDDLCALSNQNSMYVATKGIKEYQVIEDKIYLTLLATTSQLGKPNLEYRPGRASGDTTKKGHVMLPTPRAELLGNQQFNFLLVHDSQPFNETTAADIKHEYFQQEIYYQRQGLNKFINRLDNKIMPGSKIGVSEQYQYSLLNIECEGYLSSISPSLVDDSFILRIANPTASEISLQLPIDLDYQFINAIEQPIQAQNTIDPYDFVTIKLKL